MHHPAVQVYTLYQIHTNTNVFILLLGKVVIQVKSQTETTLSIFTDHVVANSVIKL